MKTVDEYWVDMGGRPSSIKEAFYCGWEASIENNNNSDLLLIIKKCKEIITMELSYIDKFNRIIAILDLVDDNGKCITISQLLERMK